MKERTKHWIKFLVSVILVLFGATHYMKTDTLVVFVLCLMAGYFILMSVDKCQLTWFTKEDENPTKR